jgi:hypothetical protein
MIDYINHHPVEVITFGVLIITGFGFCYGIGYYVGLTQVIPLIGSGVKVVATTADIDQIHSTLSDVLLTLKAIKIAYDSSDIVFDITSISSKLVECQELLVTTTHLIEITSKCF